MTTTLNLYIFKDKYILDIMQKEFWKFIEK